MRGYADVVDHFDGVAHRFGGDLRFFGDGYVAGACRYDGDLSFAVRGLVAEEADSARSGEVFTAREGCQHCRRHCGRGSCDQDIALVIEEPGRNGDNLFGGLAHGKDHFRNAVTQRPVMVHIGKTEVFEREVAYSFQCRFDCR